MPNTIMLNIKPVIGEAFDREVKRPMRNYRRYDVVTYNRTNYICLGSTTTHVYVIEIPALEPEPVTA